MSSDKLVDNSIQAKLPWMFDQLEKKLRNAAIISRAGHVKETCLSLAGLINDMSNLQSALLLSELNSPITKSEPEEKKKGLPTFNDVCNYILTEYADYDDFQLGVDLDRNTGNVILSFKMTEREDGLSAIIKGSNQETTIQKAKDYIKLHGSNGNGVFLVKHQEKPEPNNQVELLTNLDQFYQWFDKGTENHTRMKTEAMKNSIKAMTPVTLEGFRSRLSTDGKDYVFHDFHITNSFSGGMFRVIFVIDKNAPCLSSQEVIVKIDSYLDNLNEHDYIAFMGGFVACSWIHAPGIIPVSPNNVFSSGIVSRMKVDN